MNEILAFELIESLDKDGDSLINFEEYLKYIPSEEPQEKCHYFIRISEIHWLVSLQTRQGLKYKTKTWKLYLWATKILKTKMRTGMSLTYQHLQASGK